MSKLTVYTDGGARGNPGPAACGVVIKNENEEIIFEASKYLGTATNNQAEYEALILALQKAREMFEKENSKDGNIESYLDSELIVKQLNGEYRIKNEGLKPLYEKVSSLKKHFNSIKFIHIPREKNKLADKLVNRELDAHE